MTKKERLQRDVARLAEMKSHEDELRQQGYEYIAGVDEVGRGPLAGPVYAACVLLPPDFDVLGIYDSKKLSAKKREELAAVIKEKAVAYGIGIADNREIDEINILEATKVAMARAVDKCNERLQSGHKILKSGAKEAEKSAYYSDREAEKTDFINDKEAGAVYKKAGEADDIFENKLSAKNEYIIDYILVDALKLNLGIPCEGIVKGDEKSLSIAAASIIAKVARDKYMEEMDAEYPGYDFASNKGYGTAVHYDGLRRIGFSPIHRRTFLKKFEGNPNTGHNIRRDAAYNTEQSGSVKNNADSNEELIVKYDSPHDADSMRVNDNIIAEAKKNKMGKKVYAVKKGRTTGLFMSWEDCRAQVDGFAGAEYKSFADPQDAMAYLGLATGNASANKKESPCGVKDKGRDNTKGADVVKKSKGSDRDKEEIAGEVLPPGNRAYVDGSYDSSSNRFSCGVVIIETDANGVSEITELKAVFEDDAAALQRNVAGEVMGAKTAIDYCIENGITDIEIYHDYEGVGKWADGLWKANNPLTQGYKHYIADARRCMSIRFIKVKAHAGNKYNEMADKLAKKALDL